jgi:hypothetical protein
MRVATYNFIILYIFFSAVKNETEILTAVAIKVAVLRGVTPCSLV